MRRLFARKPKHTGQAGSGTHANGGSFKRFWENQALKLEKVSGSKYLFSNV
jgi:hypothetical protein